jgi:hypothetical protein
MAQKYAKDQPAGFANHIQKVAIVGVSHFESHDSYLKNLTLNRLEDMLARLSQKNYSRLANTQ